MDDYITTLRGQKNRVLEWLRTHGTLDPLTSLHKLSVYRLSEVIRKLRSEGHAIETEMVRSINQFGEEIRYGVYHYHGTKESTD